MGDIDKTKEQLIDELTELRQHVGELQALETERKRAEEALRESENDIRTIADNVPALVSYVDSDGCYKFINKRYEEWFGIQKEEIIGRHYRDILGEVTYEQIKDRVDKALTGHTVSYEEALPYSHGGTRWVIARYVPDFGDDGKVKGFFALVTDITERKRAEEALQEAEERHRAIFEQAADSIVLVDAETGELVEFNERAYESLGYSREEFARLKIPDFEVIESSEEVAEHIRKIVKEGSDVFETKHTTKHGEIRDIQVSSRAISIGGKNFIQSIWRDITERKRAEEALRESEENFRLLAENSNDGFAISYMYREDTGVRTYVNSKLQELTGYSEHELLNLPIPTIIHPTERDRVAGIRRRRLAGEPAPRHYETILLTKDGRSIPVEVTVSSTVWQGKSAVMVVYRDISERKRAEEREKQLQQELYVSSRLAAVGELASGIAHEINNPLTGVLGFSERLLRKSTDEKVKPGLELIHNEAQRAARVVQNLLAFARRRGPAKEHSDINDILQRALELRGYELETSNIEVATDLAPSLPQIMVDFNQIEEVFLNIILNAEQVMAEAHSGGKLTIKTQETKDHVRISFSDDSPGIPAEDFDRVFDPFFTTRREKGGTGLGLSICHGIVTEHGGRIYARSKPGKGATFFVELPCA